MATVVNKTTKQVIRSAKTPNYPTADWHINPPSYVKTMASAPHADNLFTEIDADATITPKVCVGWEWSGGNVTIWMDQALSAAEETALDAVVAAHDSETLAEMQDRLQKACAGWMQYKLEVGTFTHGGVTFPTAFAVQHNLMGMDILDQKGAITYPYVIRSADNRTEYSIPNAADKNNLVKSGLDAAKAEIDAYRAAVKLIMDATTKAGAQAGHDGYYGT